MDIVTYALLKKKIEAGGIGGSGGVSLVTKLPAATKEEYDKHLIYDYKHDLYYLDATSNNNYTFNKISDQNDLTLLENKINNKQEKLVNGSTIKRVDGQDILGSGNLLTKSLKNMYWGGGPYIGDELQKEQLYARTGWKDETTIQYLEGNRENSWERPNPVSVIIFNSLPEDLKDEDFIQVFNTNFIIRNTSKILKYNESYIEVLPCYRIANTNTSEPMSKNSLVLTDYCQIIFDHYIYIDDAQQDSTPNYYIFPKDPRSFSSVHLLKSNSNILYIIDDWLHFKISSTKKTINSFSFNYDVKNNFYHRVTGRNVLMEASRHIINDKIKVNLYYYTDDERWEKANFSLNVKQMNINQELTEDIIEDIIPFYHEMQSDFYICVDSIQIKEYHYDQMIGQYNPIIMEYKTYFSYDEMSREWVAHQTQKETNFLHTKYYEDAEKIYNIAWTPEEDRYRGGVINWEFREVVYMDNPEGVELEKGAFLFDSYTKNSYAVVDPKILHIYFMERDFEYKPERGDKNFITLAGGKKITIQDRKDKIKEIEIAEGPDIKKIQVVDKKYTLSYTPVRSIEGIDYDNNQVIQDLVTKNEIKLLPKAEDLEKKQDELISGKNIKTINGEEILGNGNIEIKNGGSSIQYVSELPLLNDEEYNKHLIYLHEGELFFIIKKESINNDPISTKTYEIIKLSHQLPIQLEDPHAHNETFYGPYERIFSAIKIDLEKIATKIFILTNLSFIIYDYISGEIQKTPLGMAIKLMQGKFFFFEEEHNIFTYLIKKDEMDRDRTQILAIELTEQQKVQNINIDSTKVAANEITDGITFNINGLHETTLPPQPTGSLSKVHITRIGAIGGQIFPTNGLEQSKEDWRGFIFISNLLTPSSESLNMQVEESWKKLNMQLSEQDLQKFDKYMLRIDQKEAIVSVQKDQYVYFSAGVTLNSSDLYTADTLIQFKIMVDETSSDYGKVTLLSEVTKDMIAQKLQVGPQDYIRLSFGATFINGNFLCYRLSAQISGKTHLILVERDIISNQINIKDLGELTVNQPIINLESSLVPVEDGLLIFNPEIYRDWGSDTPPLTSEEKDSYKNIYKMPMTKPQLPKKWKKIVTTEIA